MPQPTDSTTMKARWDSALLAKRPLLAAHIGTIAALWTEVEINISQILGAMCGVQSGVAVSIYVALASTGARIDALKSIAAMKLRKPTQEKLISLLKEFRRRSGERNNIVHGIWGISDVDANCLLHQPSDHHAILIAAMLYGPWTHKGPKLGKYVPTVRVQKYIEADFVAIEDRILKLKEDAWNLARLIHEPAWRRRIKATKRRTPQVHQVAAPQDNPRKTSP
jgi:hypothetical protein